MVSDQGTNLLGATEILGIDAVNDCSHVLMNALKKELADDTQVRRIISSPTRTLKTSGINQQSRESWCRHLAAYRRKNKLCPLAEKIVSTVNNYFDRHEYLLEKHGRLICCSDIIESVFGRYKNKGGMKVISTDVLHIPLYTRTIDVAFVVQGLGQVNQPMLREWHNECSCDNRFSILYRLRKEAETVTAAA